MKKWALVINSCVHETTVTDPSGRFHPNLQWEPCKVDVQEGWRFAANVFSPPIELIQNDIKAEKLVSIKAKRYSCELGGFKVDSTHKWFHSDGESRIKYLGLKDKARDLLVSGGAITDQINIRGQSVKWKTMDGSFSDVTVQIAFDIVAAAVDLDAQIFVAYETHKVAMDASANPADYNFSDGWPKAFGE